MAEVQARTVLWYLVFIGFAVNYMIRINLNITIVEMIAARGGKLLASPPATKALTTTTTTTRTIKPTTVLLNIEKSHQDHNVMKFTVVDHSPFYNNETLLAEINTKYSMERHIFELMDVPYETDGFHWNEYEQGLVLGSFYWAHWITQIPGGILAKKYGTKLVFGLSNVIGCWMCFLIPISSYWDYRALVWLRVLQGLVTGLSWPAMHVLTAKWIPPNERSKFVTAYLGSSVGIAVFYPLFGYVMHWTSWEWVYHICGIIGTLWWLGWLVFVYDTPAEHPRIEESEVRYIEKALGSSVQHTDLGPTPWRAIFTSRPVWMNVIAQFGGIWGLFTLMTQAPTYFRVIHNWNIKATGLLSGLPHFMRMFFAMIFSMLVDYLLRTDKMSRTNLRKLATACCCIAKGIVVLALAYYGHNSNAAIVYLTVATMLHGAVSSGPLASIVDIAPNYAGIVLGISGMVGVLPGFISPYIVGIMTLGNQTYEAWRNVFLISAIMLIGSGVIYVLFADSTLQSWNSGGIRKTSNAFKELQPLQMNNKAGNDLKGKEAKADKLTSHENISK